MVVPPLKEADNPVHLQMGIPPFNKGRCVDVDCRFANAVRSSYRRIGLATTRRRKRRMRRPLIRTIYQVGPGPKKGYALRSYARFKHHFLLYQTKPPPCLSRSDRLTRVDDRALPIAPG